MNNKRFYVYSWVRLDINKVFYIGKGSKDRYKDLSMRNKHFLNIVNLLGMENIRIDILESNLEEKEAFEKEIYYISYFKEQGHPLTNLSTGGEGSSGWFDNLSEEEKEKHREISKSFLGKKHTEETKNKIRNSHYGIKPSNETKEKLRQAALGRESYWKGKKLPEEIKKKISQTRLEKNIPSSQSKKVIILDSNFNIKATYDSRTKAIQDYDYSIRYCVEYNKNIKSLKEAKIHKTGLIFIYNQDYILLKS